MSSSWSIFVPDKFNSLRKNSFFSKYYGKSGIKIWIGCREFIDSLLFNSVIKGVPAQIHNVFPSLHKIYGTCINTIIELESC